MDNCSQRTLIYRDNVGIYCPRNVLCTAMMVFYYYYNLTDDYNRNLIENKTNSPSSCVTMSRSVVQLILFLTIIDRCAGNRLFASDIEKRKKDTNKHYCTVN